MAKRRKKRTITNKRKQQDAYVHAIVIMVFSVLLAVLIYIKSGYIGEHLSPTLGGLIGWIKYLVPIGVFFIGVSLIKNKREYVMPKLLQYAVIILCLCAFLTSIQLANKQLNINNDFSKVVNEAYDLGAGDKGGGVIGALVAVPMTKMLGTIGTNVVLIGVALILAIFTFGINPAEIAEKISDRIKEAREYEEDDDEEIIEPKKKKKEKAKKMPSVIMENPFIDDEEPKKYEHDISLPFQGKKAKAEEQIKGQEFIDANLFKEKEEEKEDKTKQVLQLEHAQIVEDQNYEFPPIALLEQGEGRKAPGSKKTLTDNAIKLQKTLYSFGVSAKVEDVSVGPAITRYELKPAEGVRVSKIANLADDIALNLAAQSIRIEAPIPGKQAVGIEIPNKETEMVHLRDVIDSEEFVTADSKLSMGLGKDVSGQRVIIDIAKMPHLLVAGSTGSGKSVCINTLITSIIYKAKPSEVKLVMVDPKIVELSVYNGIPHLLIPVVTDPKKAAGALAWAVQEMEDRYAKFASKGVRDIKGYNKALESGTEEEQNAKMPQIVIIVDELADLMMVASKDVEDAICRLAQKARAAGMHLVIATQRPSVDVITGLIKANIPSRIAFAVSSQIDSRTILDMPGAEKLLGKGDMLYYPTGVSKPIRVQGTFVSDKEVEKIVDFLKKDGEATYNPDIIESIERANKTDKEVADTGEDDDDVDPRLEEAIEEVITNGQASTSFIQRRLKVGYARAGRIIDQMTERGIISGYQGSKPREVLMTRERWEELKQMPAESTNVEE